MSDENQEVGNEQAGGDSMNVPIQVVAHFVRDMSFENPSAVDMLLRPVPPIGEDEINVAMNVRPLSEPGLYEVSLRTTVKGGGSVKPIFVVELDYTGIFRIGNAPTAVVEQVLAVECPRILFPYAAMVIANMSQSGGLPPLILRPVDFGAAYAAQKAQQGAPVGTA